MKGIIALGAALAGTLGAAAAQPAGLEAARRNYPPLIMGANVQPSDGTMPRACPAPGGRVETKGGPTFEYDGASPQNPNLCRLRVDGQPVEGWYAIWLTNWGGADRAEAALREAMSGRTGDVVAFDVDMGPGYAYHDLIRNEGVETIKLLGGTYRAMKLSHYREGIAPNIYRSVATVWKDMDTGMLVYGTYQHISGAPVIDDPLIPTAIVPPPR